MITQDANPISTVIENVFGPRAMADDPETWRTYITYNTY
jgi:hypothetical protein